MISLARQREAAPYCLDLEFVPGSPPQLQLLQVARAESGPHLFDAKSMRSSTILNIGGQGCLRDVIGSPNIVKVLHDARQDQLALSAASASLAPGSVFDKQIAHEVLRGAPFVGLYGVLRDWLGQELPNKDKMKAVHAKRHDAWSVRPLPREMIDYAAQDVEHLPRLYKKMLAEAKQRGLLQLIFDKSTERLPAAPGGGGRGERLPARGRGGGGRDKPADLDAALEFGRALLDDPDLRKRCEDRAGFAAEFRAWHKAKVGQGISMRWSSPSTALFKIARLSSAKRRELGVVEINVRAGRIIVFGKGSRSKKALEDAKERVYNSREKIQRDKGGVAVVGDSEFATVARPADSVKVQVLVKNEGGVARTLQNVKLLRGGSTGFSTSHGALPFVIRPGKSTTIEVSFAARNEGWAYKTLNLIFDGFSIGRFLEARCGDIDLLDTLKAEAPYDPKKVRMMMMMMCFAGTNPLPVSNYSLRTSQRRNRQEHERARNQHPREQDVPPPKGAGGKKFAVSLGRYEIPYSLRHQFNSRNRDGISGRLENLYDELAQPLPAAAEEVYKAHYANLLWTEELQLHNDLAEFNLVEDQATVLRRVGNFYSLHVKGLAEKRQSVLKGDLLRINLLGKSKTWQGRAEKIEQEDVHLDLDASFPYISGQKVEVRFVLNRSPLRFFHQGVKETSHLPTSILFPMPNDTLGALSEPRHYSGDILSSNVRQNDAQRTAVQAVVEGVHRSVPYVIFGPPGTGKTTTVVETIVQCTKLRGAHGAFRILVVAPTNTAADLVATLCLKTGALNDTSKLYRLMAYSRAKREVPEELVKFTSWDGENFSQPALAVLEAKQVIIATLSTAAKLKNNGVKRGSFDLIVVDEAGQATEPEACAAVACLLGGTGQLVLAGDHKQLGPVIHSTEAKDYGLACSFLERIMSRELYLRRDDGTYNSRHITQLVNNYRSHPDLLKVPNRLFYDGSLVPCAAQELQMHCSFWEGLVKSRIPLIFHGIVGQDQRESNSPSWFNPDEVVVVMDYVKRLLDVRGKGQLQPHDIGVIAPYQKQCLKLKAAFEKKGFNISANGEKEAGRSIGSSPVVADTVLSRHQDRLHRAFPGPGTQSHHNLHGEILEGVPALGPPS